MTEAFDRLQVRASDAVVSEIFAVEDKAAEESDTSSSSEETAPLPECKKISVTYTGYRNQFIRAHKTGVHAVEAREIRSLDEITEGDVHAWCKIRWKSDDMVNEAKAKSLAEDSSVASDDEIPSSDEED